MKIVEDMAESGGALAPLARWLRIEAHTPADENDPSHFAAAYSEAGFERKFSTMEKLLVSWIGEWQMGPITVEMRERYRKFITHCDPLRLWRANVDESTVSPRLTTADLGSIMDLNLIYAAAASDGREKTLILDVGGGYGRLAEAALNVFGKSIGYVLVDSAPGSLCYAPAYLQRACSNARIGSYFNGDPFDMDRFDCFVVPSWRFDDLNELAYDVCVNIESFQEMAAMDVERYLRLFDRVGRAEATVYISNGRDYPFRGDWSYPRHWRKLICTSTPRSWTADHPTEILTKSTEDWSEQNALVDAAYRYSLEHTS